MNPKYLKPNDLDFCAAHVAEECGEVNAVLGKIRRWGWLSYNPELPENERESNLDWLRREMADLRSALDRLDNAIFNHFKQKP